MRSLFLALLTAATFTGCLTYHWRVVDDTKVAPDPPKPLPLPKDQVPAFITVEHGADPHHFTVHNNSASTVFISFRESVMEASGKSHRVVSGETKQLHADQDSPDTPIAPATSADVSFYSDTLSSLEEGQVVKFRIALRQQGKETQAILHSRLEVEEEEEKDLKFTTHEQDTASRVLCVATIGIWCRLKLPTQQDRDDANQKAKKYGPNAKAEFLHTSM